MDRACFFRFALHPFAFYALMPKKARILNCDCYVPGERLQDVQLVVREGIRLFVVDAQGADDLPAGFQWKVDRRACLSGSQAM